jgi:hypothetical protein
MPSLDVPGGQIRYERSAHPVGRRSGIPPAFGPKPTGPDAARR